MITLINFAFNPKSYFLTVSDIIVYLIEESSLEF